MGLVFRITCCGGVVSSGVVNILRKFTRITQLEEEEIKKITVYEKLVPPRASVLGLMPGRTPLGIRTLKACPPSGLRSRAHTQTYPPWDEDSNKLFL